MLNTLCSSKPFHLGLPTAQNRESKLGSNSCFVCRLHIRAQKLMPPDDPQTDRIHRLKLQDFGLHANTLPVDFHHQILSHTHTHTTIKLLTLPRLSLPDKTLSIEPRDYRRRSGRLCHTEFTCLVFIVWLLLSISSPHT